MSDLITSILNNLKLEIAADAEYFRKTFNTPNLYAEYKYGDGSGATGQAKHAISDQKQDGHSFNIGGLRCVIDSSIPPNEIHFRYIDRNGQARVDKIVSVSVASSTWTCEKGCGYDGNSMDRAECEVCKRGKGD